MKYSAELSIDSLGTLNETVETMKRLGKQDVLMDEIEQVFANSTPSIKEIIQYIDNNKIEILKKAGVDVNGNPIDTKMFKVFIRLTCTSEQEIEAKNPEEAREIANDLVWEDPDFGFLTVYRDDIESAVPVAYEESGSFETHDYDPSEEEADALEKSLVGSCPYSLVRVDSYAGCAPEITSSLIFGRELCLDTMRSEFARVLEKHDGVDLNCFMDPEDGNDECYVHMNDGSEIRWFVKIPEMKFKKGDK